MEANSTTITTKEAVRLTTKPRKRARLIAVRGNCAISANIDRRSREAARAAAIIAAEVFGVNSNNSLIYRAGARALYKHLKAVAQKIQALPVDDPRREKLIEAERNLLIVAGAANE